MAHIRSKDTHSEDITCIRIIQSDVVLFRNQAEQFKSWPNGLEVG